MKNITKTILYALLAVMLLFVGCAGTGDESNDPAESVNSENSVNNTSGDQSANESLDDNSGSESSDPDVSNPDVSGPDTSNPDTSDPDVSNPDVSNPGDEPQPDANLNPLTGLYDLTDEAVGKRPVAVMVNNIKKSLPQYGIAQADIIFELQVEGGLTRFMALYADYTTLPKICSIRSCRQVFPELSESFDAIYVHVGVSDDIVPYLNTLGLTRYNGASNQYNLFPKDQDRLDAGYGREHTVYFDGPNFPTALVKDKVRLDLEEDKTGAAFLFNETATTPVGKACTYLNIDFGSNKSGFTYDEATKTYLKDFKGEPQIDGVTKTQLAFTNLLIFETDIYYHENGIHRIFDWHGGKDAIGYYISQGVVQEIYWVKQDVQSKLKLYDKDGNELSINCGKSYIAFNEIGETEFDFE